MRSHRFYVSQPLGEEVVTEDVSLIHQWTKVFRYTTGDIVILFNGDGNDYRYSLSAIEKKSCTLQCAGSTPSYIPSQKITLCLSLIKKDNFELAVQKVTELGVTSVIPILSSRSEKKNISFERLDKITQESAEQCGRGDIPAILPVRTLEEALSSLTEQQHAIIVNMGGESIGDIKKHLGTKEAVLFIGPEGGWGGEDLAVIEGHLHETLSLGETVLRAETAAIAACTLLLLS